MKGLEIEMASPESSEEPVEGSWQECWGVWFKWTDGHLTPKQLGPLIYSYDTIATEAAESLYGIAPPSHDTSAKNEGSPQDIKPEDEKTTRRDMYELMQEYASKDEKVGKLWAEINTVPEWVDWEQIERGQKIFFRYGGPAISSVRKNSTKNRTKKAKKIYSLRIPQLTFLSLLGGMGSARTVETLDRTGGFDVKVVRRRLLETVQHTLNVHRDIRPGGDGFKDSVRVRLLHASVRRRILQMASQQPGYYDTARSGVPINDLDSLGTINVFSAAIIWIGLPRQGIYMRQQEILDYLALWRYVAYVMGTPHDWMATPTSAKCMMQSLAFSEIRPSAASANLANNILTGLADQPPAYASREFMCAQTHWLNGRALADKLDVERPGWYYFCLVLGQCVFFMTVSYINRSIGFLDERHIRVSHPPHIFLFSRGRQTHTYLDTISSRGMRIARTK
ncbi:hypothetical protein GGR50DRAFT_677685 [Xylaria sp. CBS 124048]|nr:hypothetical protein GGR50DRAFT_677685 [Xylaria sp. CBS 124048]